MAKKSRERGRTDTANPFEDPESTRAAPLDGDLTGPLELPPMEEPTALQELPPIKVPAGLLGSLPRGAGRRDWAADEGPGRTHYSSQAALLATLLKEKFQHRSFGVAPPRVLRIDEPEGPSTAGGRLARQPLSLVAQGDAVPSAPCGWVDTAKREAQLRSYELVAARYEARHGLPLNLTPEEYDSFLEALVEALMAGSIKVRVFVPEPASTQVPARPRPRPLRRAGQLAALALLFALGMLAGRLLPWDAFDAMLARLGVPVGQRAP